MILSKSDFELDFLMACRCAYYCDAISIISDQDYDEQQKEYELLNDPLPVGSSLKEDYTPAQRALAIYFIFSGHFIGGKKSAPKGLQLLS